MKVMVMVMRFLVFVAKANSNRQKVSGRGAFAASGRTCAVCPRYLLHTGNVLGNGIGILVARRHTVTQISAAPCLQTETESTNRAAHDQPVSFLHALPDSCFPTQSRVGIHFPEQRSGALLLAPSRPGFPLRPF